MNLSELLADESRRRREFPVLDHRVFLAHAAVAVLPRVAAQALRDFAETASTSHQENASIWALLAKARGAAARLIGAKAGEIALLGPTALGLSLVARGLKWQAGDEVVFYQDDYPANVYPWLSLKDQGVLPVALQPDKPGHLTWEVIEKSLSSQTKLLALASAHFLTGYRIDLPRIGSELKKRGILFCLDGIQTVGAFPTLVEHVDFLSADSHKWMLGPIGTGIFYVKECHFEKLKPVLLGSWNVESPDFIAQEQIAFYEGARRYEPGSLNLPGIFAMQAASELILELGVDGIAQRLLHLRSALLERLQPLGYRPVLGPEVPEENLSGIVAFHCPEGDLRERILKLEKEEIAVSWRKNRQGETFLRVSPHFYNKESELDRLAEALA